MVHRWDRREGSFKWKSMRLKDWAQANESPCYQSRTCLLSLIGIHNLSEDKYTCLNMSRMNWANLKSHNSQCDHSSYADILTRLLVVICKHAIWAYRLPSILLLVGNKMLVEILLLAKFWWKYDISSQCIHDGDGRLSTHTN
jgi:hypothetical protein